jgi:hypothetical protein
VIKGDVPSTVCILFSMSITALVQLNFDESLDDFPCIHLIELYSYN